MQLERVQILTQATVRTTPVDGPALETMLYATRQRFSNVTTTSKQRRDKDGGIFCVTIITVQQVDPSERAKLAAESGIRECCDIGNNQQGEIEFTFPSQTYEDDDLTPEAAPEEAEEETAADAEDVTDEADDSEMTPEERATLRNRMVGEAPGAEATGTSDA